LSLLIGSVKQMTNNLARPSLESLNEICRLVGRGGDPGEILAHAVLMIQGWASIDLCSVYLVDADMGAATLFATTAPARDAGNNSSAALAAQIAETSEAQASGCFAGAPALYRGEFHGAVVVQTREPGVFEGAASTMLEMAAAYLAPVLADARDAARPAAHASSQPSVSRVRKLARSIAHDLNNRMMPIVGHAELMLDEVRRLENADLEEGCMAIRESGYEAAQLIQQLLQLGTDETVDPQPGGATPVSDVAAAAVDAGAGRFQSYRVLVVDDDDRMLELIEVVLRSRLGCRVDRASNGADAASALDNGDFNLVLSDILMPRMNGVELMQWVDANRPHVSPRIVFMTGDVNPKGPSGEIRRAGRPVLSKPFSVEALVSMAESVFEQSGRMR
jgi:two-component system cell cycle response regulator CpdR